MKKTNALIDQAAQIHAEMLTAQSMLKDTGICIALFGSARLSPQTDAYQAAYEIASQLSKKGYSILTGGGPGIMEAGNKGAYDQQGISIGLNIRLDQEQQPNAFQTHEVHFEHFASRKAVFFDKAQAFIAFEGGLGTQDEIWEALTLMQCNKIEKAPVILFGSEYWKKAIEWMKEVMVPRGLICEKDLKLFFVTDSVKDAVTACSLFH